VHATLSVFESALIESESADIEVGIDYINGYILLRYYTRIKAGHRHFEHTDIPARSGLELSNILER